MSDPLPSAEGRQAEGLTSALERVAASLDVVLNKAAAMASALDGAGGQAEILSGRLERVGGSFASLSELENLKFPKKTTVPEASNADQIPWYEQVETGGRPRSVIYAQMQERQGLTEGHDNVAARDFKNVPAKGSSAAKSEYTAFEKMGFVMGGGSNPLLDATKRQTDATQQLTAAINKIAQSLNPGGTGAATTNAI